MYQNLVHTEEKEGFTIRFYECEEDSNPRDSFDYSEANMQELLNEIENGNLVWFCAKVTASKEGIELASDYLGACCYKNVEDFIKPGDYYDDMVATVISEAKEVIKKLVA